MEQKVFERICEKRFKLRPNAKPVTAFSSLRKGDVVFSLIGEDSGYSRNIARYEGRDEHGRALLSAINLDPRNKNNEVRNRMKMSVSLIMRLGSLTEKAFTNPRDYSAYTKLNAKK